MRHQSQQGGRIAALEGGPPQPSRSNRLQDLQWSQAPLDAPERRGVCQVEGSGHDARQDTQRMRADGKVVQGRRGEVNRAARAAAGGAGEGAWWGKRGAERVEAG